MSVPHITIESKIIEGISIFVSMMIAADVDGVLIACSLYMYNAF